MEITNCLVAGLKRKAYYTPEEASQFLGQPIRKIMRRKDLRIAQGNKGMIGYSDLFQAHLQDVNLMQGEKRHPELEQIYNII